MIAKIKTSDMSTKYGDIVKATDKDANKTIAVLVVDTDYKVVSALGDMSAYKYVMGVVLREAESEALQHTPIIGSVECYYQ